MRKILFGLFIMTIGLALACGSSDDSASKQDGGSTEMAASNLETSGKINWMKFDDGLNAATNENKHLIAYFWRDG